MTNHSDAAIAAYDNPFYDVPEDDSQLTNGEVQDGLRSAFDAGRESIAIPEVDELAQFIRKVDGNHDLGAGRLAELIVSFIEEKNN